MNVALPAIQREIGGSLAGLQWVIDAYTLALASIMLTACAAAPAPPSPIPAPPSTNSCRQPPTPRQPHRNLQCRSHVPWEPAETTSMGHLCC